MNDPHRRVPKQQRALEKYQAILDASIVVLTREGYNGTNTSNIAKEAGVAVGSLYEYFPNKERIFTAFLEENVKQLLLQMLDSIPEQAPDSESPIFTQETLQSWLSLVLGSINEQRDVLRVIVSEVPGAINLFSLQGLENQLLPLAKFLSQEIALDEAELGLKVHVISNALYGYIIRSLFSDEEYAPDVLSKEWFSLIAAYARSNSLDDNT